jgi:glycosyltransferase involved in cell wall biosynthesis
MEFISLLKRSRVVVCLPVSSSRGYEGFYLPPLEAMAAGCLVICPPAVGNLAHCIDGYNCLMPAFSVEGIVDCVKLMMQKGLKEKHELIDNALKVVREHTLEKERESMLNLLHQADHLWSSHFPGKK